MTDTHPWYSRNSAIIPRNKTTTTWRRKKISWGQNWDESDVGIISQNLKAAIIKVLQKPITNSFETNENRENLTIEIRILFLKREPNRNYRAEKYNDRGKK